VGYQLGIDLGTTYTAAAVCRDGHAEIATLGTRSAAVPSVLYLGPDGTERHGDAANRRALTESDRVVREFKRRIGDPTPLVVGGTPYSAEALAAKQLRWVADRIAEREGGLPDAITITHPASWGPYKTDLLAQAARMAGLDAVTLLPEPEAAAIAYASAERVEPGSAVAVYDLGGGTFDAAVLRRTPAGGFELLGTPEGIERLGGIDVDESVYGHVDRVLGGALSALDPSDPATLSAVARLRQDCVDAKEALSSDTDVRIPVLLPGVRTEVRMVRGELEAMIRLVVAETIAALGRALASARLAPADLTAVLLVGGSSRIPLVAQMVSEALGRPVAVDADPKHAVALGAALSSAVPAAAPVAVSAPAVAPVAAFTGAPPRPPVGPSEPAWTWNEAPVDRRSPVWRRAALLVAAVVGTFVLLSLVNSGARQDLEPPGSPAVAAPETTEAAAPAPAPPPAVMDPGTPAPATPAQAAPRPVAAQPGPPATSVAGPSAPPPAAPPPAPAPPPVAPVPQTGTALTG
jgi:molecular chaperone DnaK (HSP70)